MQPSTTMQRDELAATHGRLVDSLVRLGDADMRGPSLLPGWTRDMLVAHLRFGAEAAIRGVTGVLAGTATTMYPGGGAQRDAEIASGAGRPAAELVADVRSACQRLEALLDDLPDAAWDELVETRRGPVAVREVLHQRWVDVEVHHVDLDVGYDRKQWPDALVDTYLPGVIALLPALRGRPDADRSVFGSWHFHRVDAAGEWTVHADDSRAWVSDGHAKADCALRGRGHDLLAYLLGRSGTERIETFGDTAKARAFKAAFPGP